MSEILKSMCEMSNTECNERKKGNISDCEVALFQAMDAWLFRRRAGLSCDDEIIVVGR